MRESLEGKWVGKRNGIHRLFGTDEAAIGRFRDACDLLLVLGMLCRVAIVETGRSTYPLWVFSRGYREALTRAGVTPDLGRLTYSAADAAELDPDHLIIRSATDADAPAVGTGLFFVVGIGDLMPTVRTTFAPLFHAPTRLNLEGLREIDRRAKDWMARLRDVQRKHHGHDRYLEAPLLGGVATWRHRYLDALDVSRMSVGTNAEVDDRVDLSAEPAR
jgi:hypothetical protein